MRLLLWECVFGFGASHIQAHHPMPFNQLPTLFCLVKCVWLAHLFIYRMMPNSHQPGQKYPPKRCALLNWGERLKTQFWNVQTVSYPFAFNSKHNLNSQTRLFGQFSNYPIELDEDAKTRVYSIFVRYCLSSRLQYAIEGVCSVKYASKLLRCVYSQDVAKEVLCVSLMFIYDAMRDHWVGQT